MEAMGCCPFNRQAAVNRSYRNSSYHATAGGSWRESLDNNDDTVAAAIEQLLIANGTATAVLEAARLHIALCFQLDSDTACLMTPCDVVHMICDTYTSYRQTISDRKLGTAIPKKPKNLCPTFKRTFDDLHQFTFVSAQDGYATLHNT